MKPPRLACLTAILALVCAWPLTGCGGSDDNGAERGSSSEGERAARTQSSAGEDPASQGVDGQAKSAGPQSPAGAASVKPAAPGATSQGQNPIKPHKSTKPKSGGNSDGEPAAGLSPQGAATYDTARALCANPDSLQYAPVEIRDDAEALAEFAERFAPPGAEQVVHEGCLAGLKSIGID